MPYFSMPPCLMSMISRRPTECSSSPTVAATTFIGRRSISARITSSLRTSGSLGMTRESTSIANGTLPLTSMRVPSCECMISRLITSHSTRFMRFAHSSAAASAMGLGAGKNMVSMTVPSASHSISGRICLPPATKSLTSSIRTWQLSVSSNSSI